jgi:hypothetical protein
MSDDIYKLEEGLCSGCLEDYWRDPANDFPYLEKLEGAKKFATKLCFVATDGNNYYLGLCLHHLQEACERLSRLVEGQ